MPDNDDIQSESAISTRPKVGLLVTCLVDLIRPQIGFATIDLLERAGCEVSVPEQQTCCGQPAFNAGATDHTARIAKQVIAAFEPYDYVVVPSGSCAAMLTVHYAEALADEPTWRERAEKLSQRTHELLSFLADVRGFVPEGVRLDAKATYHDSCSGLRELGVKSQPRTLLAGVDGLEMTPLEGNEVCCGFGGTFCVKYPAISTAIADDKVAAVTKTGADLLLGGDLGCLMNIAGRARRTGANFRILHTAEVLAGMGDEPALGEEGGS